MNIAKESKNNCETYKFSAIEDGLEIGYAYLYVIHNDSDDRIYGMLANVKVKEEYQKKGIGTSLVQEVIIEARKQKCLWLFGTSRYSRPHVHEWYKKIGMNDYGKEFRMEL